MVLDHDRIDQEMLQIGAATPRLHDPGQHARFGPTVEPLDGGVVLLERAGRTDQGAPVPAIQRLAFMRSLERATTIFVFAVKPEFQAVYGLKRKNPASC